MNTMEVHKGLMDFIFQSFFPKPIRCEIDGKVYWIERIGGGWGWRNEDGDTQEDFGIAPFAEAWECQQDAIRHAGEIECPICGDHHSSDAVPFTCETGDGA